MKSYKELIGSLQESSGGEGKVETKKYSWGTMKTVHHGASFSIPLHPEHHQAIAKLKDEQEHKFKDETGHHWVARRKGDHVHFDTTGNGSMKTHVPLHTMKEEYENVELDEDTHSELARQAASKYRSALSRGDSVAAAAANAEHLRHKRAAQALRKKSHIPGMDEEVEIVQEGADYNVTITHYVKGEDGNRTSTKHDYVIKNALSRKHAKNIAMNKHSAKVGPLKTGHSFGTDSFATKELTKESHAPVAPSIGVHRIAVTVSDPDHPSVSQRKETHQKFVRVTAHDKEKAIEQGKKHFAKKGWKVHGAEHSGMVHEEVELQEGKMGQIHADIEDHLGKHLADYKANGGAEHFANKVLKTHEHIAKLHGLEKKHAASLVNQYVDSHLKEEANLQEAVVQDLDKYFAGIKMKGAEKKTTSVKKEPESAISGSQIKFFTNFREETELSEKMNLAKADMGDVIKDFQKSDAPQFAGKSKEKKQQMAIAAKLEADRKQQNEGVIQPTGDDTVNTGADNKGKTTYTKDKSGKLVSFKYEGEWKKATKKDPRGKVTHMSDVAQRKAAAMANEEVELEEATKYVVHYQNEKGEHVNSSKAFDDKAKAQAHADKGNKVDKVGGKYTVKTMQNEEVLDEGSDHDPYFAAQKHKEAADKAHQAGEHKSYHMFMAAHHDAMAEWSAKRGRHHVAAQHEGKAQNHEDWANQTHKEEVSINNEGDFVVENKLSYDQFMSQLLEYTPGPGGVTRVQGRSYGAQYHDPEGDDDADDKPAKKAEPTAKRGRGRPAGSKSGANVKRLSSKGSNGYGYDSTGYKLHLPNSNK